MLVNTRPRVYLAGPIGPGGTETNGDWRLEATAVLKVNGLITVEPLEMNNYSVMGVADQYVPRILTDRDRRFATQSEFLLANFAGATARSLGTAVELAWADMSPTVSVTVMEEENPHRHPIIESISDYIVPDLMTACRVIVSLAADEVENS